MLNLSMNRSNKILGLNNMNQPWYVRLGWWLCSKTGHLWYSGWVYNGYYHRDCKLCGSIISKPVKEKE